MNSSSSSVFLLKKNVEKIYFDSYIPSTVKVPVKNPEILLKDSSVNSSVVSKSVLCMTVTPAAAADSSPHLLSLLLQLGSV